MQDYVARWLVQGWNEATDEHKADRFRFGPWTRAATVEAFERLGLPVPEDLPWRDD